MYKLQIIFLTCLQKDFIHDPIPTLSKKLSSEYPISRFDQWQAWLVTGHENILKLLDARLSTDFNLWEYAAGEKAIEDKDALKN